MNTANLSPTARVAYFNGVVAGNAYLDGNDIGNPYAPGTDEWTAWRAGFSNMVYGAQDGD